MEKRLPSMHARTARENLMLVCTGLFCITCFIVLLRYVTHQYFIRNLGWDNAWTKSVFYDNVNLQHYHAPRNIPDDEIPMDWSVEYPFSSVPPTPPHKNAFQKASDSFHRQAGQFDAWTNNRFLFYQDIVEIMQRYRKYIGWNIPLNSDAYSASLLPDGHWAAFQRKVDVSPAVAATIDFANFCQAHDIQFLTILAPSKIARQERYSETLDASNANGDAFFAGMQKHGIRCIDLRTFIEPSEGSNQHPLFFKADHHWKPETARRAAIDIERILNREFGYNANLSLLESSNYEEVCYPGGHLGGFGIRATLSRAVPDDLPLFYPKFPTEFHLRIPSM